MLKLNEDYFDGLATQKKSIEIDKGNKSYSHYLDLIWSNEKDDYLKISSKCTDDVFNLTTKILPRLLKRTPFADSLIDVIYRVYDTYQDDDCVVWHQEVKDTASLEEYKSTSAKCLDSCEYDNCVEVVFRINFNPIEKGTRKQVIASMMLLYNTIRASLSSEDIKSFVCAWTLDGEDDFRNTFDYSGFVVSLYDKLYGTHEEWVANSQEPINAADKPLSEIEHPHYEYKGGVKLSKTNKRILSDVEFGEVLYVDENGLNMDENGTPIAVCVHPISDNRPYLTFASLNYISQYNLMNGTTYPTPTWGDVYHYGDAAIDVALASNADDGVRNQQLVYEYHNKYGCVMPVHGNVQFDCLASPAYSLPKITNLIYNFHPVGTEKGNWYFPSVKEMCFDWCVYERIRKQHGVQTIPFANRREWGIGYWTSTSKTVAKQYFKNTDEATSSPQNECSDKQIAIGFIRVYPNETH